MNNEREDKQRFDFAMERLKDIARIYPTLAGLLNKQTKSGRVGEIWASHLGNLTQHHLEDVCEEYATLRKGLPERMDQLVHDIFAEVTEREWKERDRLEQEYKYHNQTKGEAWGAVVATRRGSIGCTLGAMVRAGRLTKEENDRRMEELKAWEDGGSKPDWLPGVSDEAPEQLFAKP